MNFGLFGGTFNPVHNGHLRVIEEVAASFELAKTYIVPAALPPHKPLHDIAAAEDRLAMIRLAAGDLPGFEISDLEINRPGPSYTVDTLMHFKGQAGKTDRIFLIVGVDAFLEIDTWKAYLDILKTAPLIVMARPAGGPGQGHPAWKRAADFIRQKISDNYVFTKTKASDATKAYQPIFFTDVTLLDISSTRIRQLIRQNKSIRFLVPEPVEAYIRQRGLYS
ncbi:MAG: nicotinate (nicotinamide) nucleotide adenylyltransferase [Deltaproteobacteria bacterium]|nr:nicotinate (nicotinamide) nucleotide adenylyltransferase [Deltaproteobacteria bacterium]